MKTLAKFLFLIFIVFIAMFFLKDLIVKNVITIFAARLTGLAVSVEKVNAGIFSSSLNVEGLRFYNPEGYAEKILAEIPEICIFYDLKGFLKKKMHLKTLKIYLKEFVVVKNNAGELNINSIKGVKKEDNRAVSVKKEFLKSTKIQIDNCDLKIDKILYKDYSKGEKSAVQEFDVYVEEHYTNISDAKKILELILFKVLFKTSLDKLLDLNLNVLSRDISSMVEKSVVETFSAGGITQGKSKEAAEEIVNNLKKAIEGIKIQFNK